MRYGIVSDIHANIQAWKAVLRDMQNEGVDAILCLGDVVGYGPNPAQVLDSCYKHVDYFILGNHDAVIGNRLDSNLFNDNAKYLIEWTREQLNSAAADFFSEMPMQMEGDGFVCAHAELALPGRFSYIYEAQDAIESFTSNQSPLMFVGHTHLPAKFTYDLSTNMVRNDSVMDGYLNAHERYLINVGSVGDPRDGSTVASYCIYDADNHYLWYRKVPFDIEKFRSSLSRAHLPIQPYFLSVYEGSNNELETIRDMQVMENNQAAEADARVERISRGKDTKTSRQKITFSLDDVRSSRQNRESKEKKKASEKKARSKGMKIMGVLALLLLLSFAGVMIWKKISEPTEQIKPEIISNKPPDVIKNSLKEITVVQDDNGALDLSWEAAKLSEGLKFHNGELQGWKLASQSLTWKVRVNKEGWYSVKTEFSSVPESSQVEVKMGGLAIASSLPNAVGENSLVLFENLQSGTMDFKISLADDHTANISGLKKVSLKFVGEEKPFDYDLEDKLLGDFESGTYSGWIISGAAFGNKPVSAETLGDGIEIKGIRGRFAAASINLKQSARGILRSPLFDIRHKRLSMVVGGGEDCSMKLIVDGNEVEQQKFSNNVALRKVHIDLKPYAGKKGYLEFIDNGKTYLVIDSVELSSTDSAEYTPGKSETIKGVKKEESVNELNKYLAKAGNKVIRREFKSALRDLEEAAVITNTDMSGYSSAVEAVSDLEKLVIKSFEKEINKTVPVFTRSLPGKATNVKVLAVKGDKVQVIVEGTQTPIMLGFNHLSEKGAELRASTEPGGILAYHIHKRSLTENISSLEYDRGTPLAILVSAATGSVKLKYPEGAVVGSLIELWALESSAKPSWKFMVSTDETTEIEAEVKDITEIMPGFKVKGLSRKAFKVYSYDLLTEKQIKKVSFKDGRGTLTSMILIIRNAAGSIVWQRSFNEIKQSEENLLKGNDINVYSRDSQPEYENLALGKSWTASDYHSGGYAGLTDGIWGFTPPFLFGSSRNDSFPKYVSVDLGDVKSLNLLRFGIPNRGSTKKITLQYSLDNNQFNPIMDFEFKQGEQARFSAYFDTVRARYVRVRFNENYEKTLNRAPAGHVFLSELEAYLVPSE